MNYQLAKELKENGFPQTWREGMDFYWIESKELEREACSDIGRDTDCRDDGIKVPNIEELVHACGDDFVSLDRKTIPGSPWMAFGYRREGLQEFDAGGLTPSEAVARLWLAFNKK